MMCADKSTDEQTRRFRDAALSCLDDAYTLAYFLTGSRANAEDAVEECYLRAAHLSNTTHAGVTKPRLLAILRSVCVSKPARHDGEEETADIVREEETSFRQLIHLLPVQLREALTLRELNDLSYHEIAEVTEVSLGTATQRVAQARTLLLGKMRQRFATTQSKTKSAA